MIFREWKYEDIAAISELEKACFRDPWSFQMLADSFMGGRFRTILCEEDGKIVGYGGAIVGLDEADIANIAVDEAHRGEKIGRKLVRKLEENLQKEGMKRVFLEVRVSNSAALALYLKCGFCGKFVRPRYYGDGEDAVIMAKDLT